MSLEIGRREVELLEGDQLVLAEARSGQLVLERSGVPHHHDGEAIRLEVSKSSPPHIIGRD